MMSSVAKVFLIWSLLAPGQHVLSSGASNDVCELPEPWVRDEVAAQILAQLPDPVHFLSQTKVSSSSVRLQLLLWGFIYEPIAFESAVMDMDLADLLARDDDYVTGLLWLVASSSEHRDRIQGVEEHIDALNTWSSAFVKEQPRRMFLYLMALSRVTGRETLSRAELEALDSQVPDPELSFHIAGKLIQEGESRAAHQKLVQAFESGSIRALYGLGDLEVSEFSGCVSRGQFYIRLFTEVWGG